MVLRLRERVGLVMLSMAAPRRLARMLLRAHPQPMTETLETSGDAERIEFEVGEAVHCRGWWVTPPQGGPTLQDHVVVLAHGWTSHALRLLHFLEPLLQMGYPVMLYSARSHGDSDPYPICSLAQFTEDVAAAIRYAHTRVPHVLVLGHSLGAAATVVAAADGAPVEGAMVLAAPADPRQASMDLLASLRVPAGLIMKRIGSYVESLIGRTFDSIAPEQRIREVGCPLLLVHGTQDEVVPFAHFDRIRQAAGPNVRTMPIDGATHDSIKTDPRTLEGIQAFLQRLCDGETP